MVYLGFLNKSAFCEDEHAPTIWLQSANPPPDGEGLANKGFEFTDRYFA